MFYRRLTNKLVIYYGFTLNICCIYLFITRMILITCELVEVLHDVYKFFGIYPYLFNPYSLGK